MKSHAAHLLGLAGTLAFATPAFAEDQIQITWLGHATFEVVSPGGTRLLIDPFISGNPSTPKERKKLGDYKPAAILVSHSHQDHSLDVEAIAKSSGAKVIGAFDHVASLKVAEGQQAGGNVGGKFVVGDVTISLVPAMHGSEPGGRPVGFILAMKNGRSIYHTGDTWIFGDMSLIQEIYKPNIILLQAGGGPYNQDPATAALAISKYFKPDVIIPMHYATFPPLATEAEVAKAFEGDKRFKLMKPGETLKL